MNIIFGKPNPGQRIIKFIKFMDIVHCRVNQEMLITAYGNRIRHWAKKIWRHDQIYRYDK